MQNMTRDPMFVPTLRWRGRTLIALRCFEVRLDDGRVASFGDRVRGSVHVPRGTEVLCQSVYPPEDADGMYHPHTDPTMWEIEVQVKGESAACGISVIRYANLFKLRI